LSDFIYGYEAHQSGCQAPIMATRWMMSGSRWGFCCRSAGIGPVLRSGRQSGKFCWFSSRIAGRKRSRVRQVMAC